MLNYFINTTVQLLPGFLIAGMALSYSTLACTALLYKKRSKLIMRMAVLVGIAGGVLMSFMKNTTNKIDTGMWNLRIFTLALVLLFLFIAFTVLAEKFKDRLSFAAVISLALIVILQLTYSLPDPLGYPYTIFTTEKTIVSTAYILKFICVLAGFILAFVTAWAAARSAFNLQKGKAFLILLLVMLINSARQITQIFNVLLAKRYVTSRSPLYHTMFVITKNASNFSKLFIYASLLALTAAVGILWYRSFIQKEPYTNSAEHRKIIAKWRSIRRWASTLMICNVLVFLTMTVVYNIANKAVELSPIEETEMDSENMYVSFDRVSDGHLHRFGYTTDDGITIRFIVIQKPNSSSYGVGLDACDICGETGYYEKDDQVVCNLCDVVMNINTIGFKGGCNPIVIPYDIKDGKIIVPISGLVEYKNEFK